MIPHSRPWITRRDVEAVAGTLAEGQIAEGALARRLEAELAARYGFPAAIMTSSGCQALYLALRGLGVGNGDQVALPTYVCPELLGVVEALGARPVLADVRDDYLLNPDDVALGQQLAAVVVPSLFGRRADTPASEAPVIHDWAHYLPPDSGSSDIEIAILSLGATKALAAGEGGAILVRNPELMERIRAFKQVDETEYALNLFPFSDLQAALATSQLDRIDQMITRRRQIADRYREALRDSTAIAFPPLRPTDVPFRLPLRLTGRPGEGKVEEILEGFAAHGIVARRPVSTMLHLLRPQERRFPVADELFRTTFSLPLHPSLTDEEVSRVASGLRSLRV